MKLNTAQLKMLKTLANYTETSPMPCGYQVAGQKGTVKLNQPTWAALQSRGLVASRGQAGVDLVKWITEEGRQELLAAVPQPSEGTNDCNPEPNKGTYRIEVSGCVVAINVRLTIDEAGQMMSRGYDLIAVASPKSLDNVQTWSDILLKDQLADAIEAGDTERVFQLDNELLRRGVWR